MKRIAISTMFLASLFLAACGADEDNAHSSHNADDQVPDPLVADLTVPETANQGQDVTFQVGVTQGDEVVTDAGEVMFEVLNTATEEKEMLEAKLNGDNQYEATYTFTNAGTYSITSHVTARDLHTMPSKSITVAGDDTSSKHAPAADQEESHAHGTGATIDFPSASTTVGENNALRATVTYNDAPLTDARVQFEIWRSDSNQHAWVEAPAIEPGVYGSDYIFTESGSYSIQIHVTKGDTIHDHIIETYTVK